MIETAKRHFLGPNRIFRAIVHEDHLSGLSFGQGEKKIHTYIYISIYIHSTQKWCYFSPLCAGAVHEVIEIKFSTLIDLADVINFANLGVDRSSDRRFLSGEQSNSGVLPALEKSSVTLCCAATHSVIIIIS